MRTIAALLLALACGSIVAHASNIEVRVEGRFFSSAAAEVVSSLGDLSAPLAFEWLQRWCQAPTSSDRTDEFAVTIATNITQRSFSDAHSALLRAELSLRTRAPRVDYLSQEAFKAFKQEPRWKSECAMALQHKGGQTEFVVGANLPVHTPRTQPVGQVEGALATMMCPSSAERSGLNPATRRLVLVAHDVADDCVCSHLSALVKHCDTAAVDEIAFAVVPAVDASGSAAQPPLIPLQGYGVTVDMKNMEYKAVDDRAAPGQDAALGDDGDVSDASNNLKGILIRRLLRRYPSAKAGLEAFQVAIESKSSSTVNDFKVWEIQNLGYQAVDYIVGRDQQQSGSASSTPFDTLTDLTENFPLRVGKVSKRSVAPENITAIQHDNMITRAHFGDVSEEARVFLFGRPIRKERLDAFGFIRSIREELESVERAGRALAADVLGVIPTTNNPPLSEAAQYMLSCAGVKKGNRDGALRLYIDSTHDSIAWLNNIETDPMYANLPKRMREYLQPGFYGQPRFARRNAFSIVLVLNPDEPGILAQAANVWMMVEQGAPLRIGVALFSQTTDNAEISAKISADGQVSTDADGLKAQQLSFARVGLFSQVARSQPMAFGSLIASLRGDEGEEGIMEVANNILSESKLSFADLVRLGTGVSAETKAWFDGLGVPLGDGGSRAFFNGALLDASTTGLDRAVYQQFNSEFMWIRQAVSDGTLTDDIVDVYAFMLTKRGASTRYHPAILGTDVVVSPWTRRLDAEVLHNLTWFYPAEHDYGVSTVSHILRLNETGGSFLGDPERLNTVRSLITTVTRASGSDLSTRLAILPCGNLVSEKDQVFGTLWQTALISAKSFTEKRRAPLLLSVLDWLEPRYYHPVETSPDLFNQLLKAARSAPALTMRGGGDGGRSVFDCDSACSMKMGSFDTMCRATQNNAESGDGAGQVPNMALITNGRVISLDVTSSNPSLTSSDILKLGDIERSRRAGPLRDCLTDGISFNALAHEAHLIDTEEMTSEYYSNKLFLIASTVAFDVETRGIRYSDTYPKTESMVSFFDVNADVKHRRTSRSASSTEVPSDGVINDEGQEDTKATLRQRAAAGPELLVVLDPISRNAQRIVALTKYVMDVFGLTCRIFLQVPSKVSSVPVKNFYRFVLNDIEYSRHGKRLTPRAEFTGLPKTAVLTLGIDDPDTWLVFASEAANDLDNIKLESGNVMARYELQSLVLSGSCIDAAGVPPQGLPLVLTSDEDGRGHVERRDTLVMANLGYFQHHVRPGKWSLDIGEGRGRDIFDIQSVVGGEEVNTTATEGAVGAGQHRRQFPVIVDSLSPDPITVTIRRIGEGPLFPPETVAEENASASWPPTPAGDRAAKPLRPTLNILSLASGHLYERFLRMMMHTVMNASHDRHGANTTRIKFWLIENPTSPKFRQFIPKMAAAYGFEYEFVRYKWPYWLRRQSEKQRMIWAYKVLFLDVLFPLDVEKVIFVDADQIVNSDLHELYNMDLERHALAYTPFCQKAARNETMGFRFWNSGYWNDHLRGKPYIISAIYVVDLARFRRRGVGDQYRVIYENLSADPNSLANLDQDLPNYAQFQVPLFHLPEEWLWCESWCNDESKSRAKTIDLCNNPRTKAPKLDNARRVIPYWDELDRNLTAFEKSVE